MILRRLAFITGVWNTGVCILCASLGSTIGAFVTMGLAVYAFVVWMWLVDNG